MTSRLLAPDDRQVFASLMVERIFTRSTRTLTSVLKVRHHIRRKTNEKRKEGGGGSVPLLSIDTV